MTPEIRSLLERIQHEFHGSNVISWMRLHDEIRDALYKASKTPPVDPHAVRVTAGRVNVFPVGSGHVFECSMKGWKGGVVVEAGIADKLFEELNHAVKLLDIVSSSYGSGKETVPMKAALAAATEKR